VIVSAKTRLTQKRKDTHTMPKDNVVDFKKPETFIDDPITDVLRTGAKKLLAEALEAEIESFLCQYRDLRDDQGRKRVVRNGHLLSCL
jgi:putative transposase